jgi:ubiquinone/menaquinone biosynthesis C-methylase UbiE
MDKESLDKWELRRTEFDRRRDTHDFFDKDHVARFLRNHGTGVDNLGRFGLATIVKAYENPVVLDIACGTAVNHEVFKNHKVSHKYIAYDRTQQFLDHAKILYGDGIEIVRGYAQDLPFAVNEVDISILRHIGEHMHPDDFYQAIREAVRVSSKEVVLVFFLDLSKMEGHIIEERGPDERGAMYFWNTYSWPLLVKYLTNFGVKINVSRLQTPGAAHTDTIVRLIK